jgi:hypothetical protein
MLLAAAAPVDAFAGKRRPNASLKAPPGGYTIPQIRRGAKGAAPLRGFERSHQLDAGARASTRPVDPDALLRPATGPNDPTLKEFGLPYIAGVPMIAVLLPPPPVDELTAIYGPNLLGLQSAR